MGPGDPYGVARALDEIDEPLGALLATSV